MVSVDRKHAASLEDYGIGPGLAKRDNQQTAHKEYSPFTQLPPLVLKSSWLIGGARTRVSGLLCLQHYPSICSQAFVVEQSEITMLVCHATNSPMWLSGGTVVPLSHCISQLPLWSCRKGVDALLTR
ncbi:Non-reducing polyketide synthase ausA [Fusarium oxysporum f. sp. albedinis]|nr:Non-reducing polyketide synthase ausA [Fusarium oxysporum f. sp. albedinis]